MKKLSFPAGFVFTLPLDTFVLTFHVKDGMTFIMDHQGNMVKFRFEDRVRAFRAALYSVSPGKKKPCFIFVTFNDDIFIYDKIQLRSIASQSVIRMVEPVRRSLLRLLSLSGSHYVLL